MAKLKNSKFVNCRTEFGIAVGEPITITDCTFVGSHTVFASAEFRSMPKQSILHRTGKFALAVGVNALGSALGASVS
jgi:hypothetical protein